MRRKLSKKNKKYKKRSHKGGNNIINNNRINISKSNLNCNFENDANIKRNYCDCFIQDENKQNIINYIENLYKKHPQKIPKIIHQIWVGPKKRPDIWLNTFKKFVKNNPGWKYMLWDDKAVNDFDMINRDAYNNENTYNGKSDILRYELIYKYGGIYIDADTILLNNKNLNDLIKNTNNLGFFAAMENKERSVLATGVVGSSKNNLISLYIINALREISSNCNVLAYKSVGPYMLDQVLNGFSVTIFPYYYFYPEYWNKNYLEDNTNHFEKKYPNSYMFQYGYTTNGLDKFIK
jgi:inositol phosphorylceramide mannosyltransferase catalytic subunit